MENLHLIHKIRTIYWKIKYRQGKIVSHFVARDIRREVMVVDSSEIEEGYIIAKVRTWNVLYDIKGIEKKPEFGDVERLRIKDLWSWMGQPWGGTVPK